MESKVYAIIPAAGSGRRMGSSILKQYIMLGDKPVLAHTLSAFDRAGSVDCMILAVSPDEKEYIEKEIIKRYGIEKPVFYAPGGRERQESVANALHSVGNCDIVVVHDGVRPLVTPDVIEETIQAARQYGAAAAGMPVKDTIKEIDPAGFAVNTPDRSILWLIQTPQAFKLRLLEEAHKKAAEDGFLGTDDSSLVERLGHPVKLVEGGYGNIKITTPEDVDLALHMMRNRGITL
ncbi:MAG TPA: 2-C-methyl-D-erythritol 4-phosphate cytidylyltransferase [Candidatus Atribacteria bacterium]|nr:2-C-methyl-D-erythritol 4-phosphate cytidylyltransferase [Candidatus Atribacteria bacterium]